MKKWMLLFLMLLGNAAIAADGGYLFATFKGEGDPMGEQVYFVLSRDGVKWTELNDGKPVLVSTVGEKGVRDPYLLRAHDDSAFYMIATDLSVHLINHDWGKASQRGSRNIVIWKSTDLVNWGEPKLVTVAPEDAGCAWAPEAVYDRENEEYLIFWASTTGRDNFEKQRIWAVTTKDFETFSEPFIYIEKPTTIIDTTIVYDQGKYYRFTKDERDKAITMEVGDTIRGTWTEVEDFTLKTMTGYEGPACYQLRPSAEGEEGDWCLLLDNYARGRGYIPYVTKDLASGNFVEGESFDFPFRLRHGSVLTLSEEEFQRVQAAFDRSTAPTGATEAAN